MNWPKLNTPSFAVDVYQDSLSSVNKDPIMGPFVRRSRRTSGGHGNRLSNLEDGKKRIE